MTTEHDTQLRTLAAAEEIDIATRRSDGTLRSPRTIWIVWAADHAYVRSTNGRSGAWFRGALSAGAGRLTAKGAAVDVRLTEVADDSELTTVDQAYRTKYRRYSSIVDHLLDDGPRAATLRVIPL